jgi:hypothetical protein
MASEWEMSETGDAPNIILNGKQDIPVKNGKRRGKKVDCTPIARPENGVSLTILSRNCGELINRGNNIFYLFPDSQWKPIISSLVGQLSDYAAHPEGVVFLPHDAVI